MGIPQPLSLALSRIHTGRGPVPCGLMFLMKQANALYVLDPYWCSNPIGYWPSTCNNPAQD